MFLDAVSNDVQEQYLWIEGYRKQRVSHVLEPYSDQVQEQYRWIDRSRKPGFHTFADQFEMKFRNSICGLRDPAKEGALRAPALQSVV